MAQRMLAMGFLGMTIVATMFAGSSAQSGCTTAIISLAPCLGYISGNSSTPSSSCCSALSSVVQSNPKCLCSVLSGGASSFGVTINNTKALEMPAACKVQTPPVSECNKVGAPAAAPTTTPTAQTAPAPKESTTPAAPSTVPAPQASETPSVPTVTPAGSGSKATPSTGTTTTVSAGSIETGTASVLFVAAVASFTVFLV